VLGLGFCDLDIGLGLGPNDFDTSLIYLSGHSTVSVLVVIILIN